MRSVRRVLAALTLSVELLFILSLRVLLVWSRIGVPVVRDVFIPLESVDEEEPVDDVPDGLLERVPEPMVPLVLFVPLVLLVPEVSGVVGVVCA